MEDFQGLVGLIIFLSFIFFATVKVSKEYERAIVFRLGRSIGIKGPGLYFLIPGIDRAEVVSIRIIALDIPPQDIITKDNISVKISAVVYFRIINPEDAIIKVENFMYATSQIAQTTLRSVTGQGDLDDLLSEREAINHEIQTILDKHTNTWGIKISSVEIKQIDLPQEMQRAMAKQAEAERERRSKIILADAELQASIKLSEAAAVLERNPASIQLRYLQTLSEIATENNSTTIFPVPIEFLSLFKNKPSPSISYQNSEADTDRYSKI